MWTPPIKPIVMMMTTQQYHPSLSYMPNDDYDDNHDYDDDNHYSGVGITIEERRLQNKGLHGATIVNDDGD